MINHPTPPPPAGARNATASESAADVATIDFDDYYPALAEHYRVEPT